MTACPDCCAHLRLADPGATGRAAPRPALHEQLIADAQAPAEARQALDRLGRELGGGTLETLKLLVSELVTNSVRHATPGEVHTAMLDVALSPNIVRVEVRDEGPGFTPEPRAADTDLGSRWGLVIVEELSERWGVDSDGRTRVWFELDRNGESAGRRSSRAAETAGSRA